MKKYGRWLAVALQHSKFLKHGIGRQAFTSVCVFMCPCTFIWLVNKNFWWCVLVVLHDTCMLNCSYCASWNQRVGHSIEASQRVGDVGQPLWRLTERQRLPGGAQYNPGRQAHRLAQRRNFKCDQELPTHCFSLQTPFHVHWGWVFCTLYVP